MSAGNAKVGRRGAVLAGLVAMTHAVHAALPGGAKVLAAPFSLADALDAALAQKQPLIILVCLPGCPVCKVARENYLLPLRQQEGLPIYQIDMRAPTPVRDFQRHMVTHDAITRTWDIKVAPTVLFFGSDAQEAAERLRGASIPDFYGSYLEQRIQDARATVRRAMQ